MAEIDKLDVIGYSIINTLVTINSGNLTIADTALTGKDDNLTIQANTSGGDYIIKDPPPSSEPSASPVQLPPQTFTP